MGLPWLMIGVLADDHHLHLIKRTEVKGIKNQFTRRIAGRLHILLPYSLSQLCEIWLLKLTVQVRLPTLFYLYCHAKKKWHGLHGLTRLFMEC